MFTAIFTILTLSISIPIIIDLYNFAKKKETKLQIRIISGIGSIIIAVITSILLIYGFVVFVFTYEPEYIIEKNRKPMVAYVNSFLEVNVSYYDYVNRFVRGNRLKISESYGKGGYDPFKSDELPTVERSIYYDDNGRVIK